MIKVYIKGMRGVCSFYVKNPERIKVWKKLALVSNKDTYQSNYIEIKEIK